MARLFDQVAVFGTTRRLRRDGTRPRPQVPARAVGRDKLEEANRLLSALLEIADDLPGGLDATTVAAAICAEVRSLAGVPAVAVFVEDRGLLHVAASHALRPGKLPALRVDAARRVGDLEPRPTAQLPAELQLACEEHPTWLGAQLGDASAPVGFLLVALERAEVAPRIRPVLARLRSDATIALQNARLFDGTLARAADAARRRLAADLHDGVAQSLAHLKMELELHTVADGRRTADAELARLARVAGTALTELRATIDGLRTDATGDLANLLEEHIAAVSRADGPRLHLDLVGTADLSPDRVDDALRIAQEALSNALRHADARNITVSLERDHELTELVVEDDGSGRGASSERAGGGVGRRSMAERAARLGGTLAVRDRLGGGTVVTLRFPTRPAFSPAPATYPGSGTTTPDPGSGTTTPDPGSGATPRSGPP